MSGYRDSWAELSRELLTEEDVSGTPEERARAEKKAAEAQKLKSPVVIGRDDEVSILACLKQDYEDMMRALGIARDRSWDGNFVLRIEKLIERWSR